MGRGRSWVGEYRGLRLYQPGRARAARAGARRALRLSSCLRDLRTRLRAPGCRAGARRRGRAATCVPLHVLGRLQLRLPAGRIRARRVFAAAGKRSARRPMDGRRPRRGRAEARSRGDRARRACARRAGGRAPRFAALQPRVGAGRAARHRAHGRHAGVRRRRASSVEAAHMKLEDFLAQVPQGDLWVFGYGSLMWSPGFGYKQKRLARAYGYHRALCILSTRYRGTHRRPGLVVGLCRGGSCWGMAFLIDAAHVRVALTRLWNREMPRRVYEPRLVLVRLRGGRLVRALAFLADPGHPSYVRELDVQGRARELEQIGVRCEASPTPLFGAGAFAVKDPDARWIVFGLPEEIRGENGLPARLQHFVCATRRLPEMVKFYGDLGMIESDRVLEKDSLAACFLRSDPEHHSFAAFRAPESRPDHHCYETNGWLDIRDWGDRMGRLGIPLWWGPGRHGPGNNLFFMIEDPDGHKVEFSAEL